MIIKVIVVHVEEHGKYRKEHILIHPDELHWPAAGALPEIKLFWFLRMSSPIIISKCHHKGNSSFRLVIIIGMALLGQP